MSTGQSSGQASAADAALAALAPLGRMNLIAIWLETVLYGINIMMYLGAVHVLWDKVKARGGTVPRYLLAVSTLLFVLSTVHVSVSLRQILQAFTNPAIATSQVETSLYFIYPPDHLLSVSQSIYCFNYFVQDLVLIWRLYAVFNGDWRLVILPLALEGVVQGSVHHLPTMLRFAQFHSTIGTAAYSVVLLDHKTPLEDPRLRAYGITCWSLHIAVNIGVTAAIAGKLWWHGRRTTILHGHNAYTGIALTLMESGALFTGGTFVLCVLFINIPTGADALVGVYPLSQLATLSPLLMITRVGFGLTHSSRSGQRSVPQIHPTSGIQVNITRSEVRDFPSSGDLYPMHDVKSDNSMTESA
ncbi:hypothetical protein BD414DRAFT_178233 [Trametes punicea]|nr:hypothetical protein BD414DRAFT_178233 [Trametes punicea]